MIFTVFDKNLKKSNNKLAAIELNVAAHNTWQGVINGNWPNTKNPLKVVGKFSKDSHNSYYVPIEVTEISHLKGNGNYSECIEKNMLDKVANPFFIPTPTNMKTSLYHNN